MAATWPDWVAELVNYIHEHGVPEGDGVAGVDMLLKAVADGLACDSRRSQLGRGAIAH